MQVLSSSQKKDITPSQLLPESMFDFIYAKDGEAVIKSGDTDFILSGGQMLIVSSADGKTMSVTKAPFKYYSFSLASEEIKKFSEIRAFLHFSLRNLKAHIIFLIFRKAILPRSYAHSSKRSIKVPTLLPAIPQKCF